MEQPFFGWCSITAFITASSGDLTATCEVTVDGIGVSTDGSRYVYKNGAVDEATSGLVKEPASRTWYLFKNGKVTPGPVLAKNAYGWWYIGSNGTIDTTYTGLAKNQWGWWYVKNGKVDTSYKVSWDTTRNRWVARKGASVIVLYAGGLMGGRGCRKGLS